MALRQQGELYVSAQLQPNKIVVLKHSTYVDPQQCTVYCIIQDQINLLV